VAKQHRTDDPAKQPDSNDQSGSTGRRTDTHENGRATNTGQDRYGQSGFGGKQGRETNGQSRYRQSGPDGGQQVDPESNEGSGRPDVDSQGERGPARPWLKKKR